MKNKDEILIGIELSNINNGDTKKVFYDYKNKKFYNFFDIILLMFLPLFCFGFTLDSILNFVILLICLGSIIITAIIKDLYMIYIDDDIEKIKNKEWFNQEINKILEYLKIKKEEKKWMNIWLIHFGFIFLNFM